MFVRSCARKRVLRVNCDIGSMPDVIQNIRGITYGFDKTNWNTFFNHSSSAASPSTATANCISKTNTVLPHFVKADSHSKERVVMVSQQSGTLQWLISYTRGQWSNKEQDLRINQQELSPIKFAILIFAKMWKMSPIHM